jgi:hypothetical protein
VSELLRAAAERGLQISALSSSTSARRRSPRATRSSRSTLGDRAGTTGAAVLAIEHIVAPDFVDAH